MCPRRVSRAILVALVTVGLLSTDVARAQEFDDVFGYQTEEPPLDPSAEWIDPAVLVGLDRRQLVDPPDFDVAKLHDSTVFAAGVDWLLVEDEELEPLVDRHVRVLQVIDTLDRDITNNARTIAIKRPRVEVLNDAIDHEHAEEARLAHELTVLRTAIAEFAVRAFISEDELDTALSVPDNDLSETRVVSDEVRVDQFVQIENREAELAERQLRRAGLEEDLRVLRSELRTLQRDRLDLLAGRRQMHELVDKTAATYQFALHQRLESFVEGTDIPLVAMNAYVIAARTLEIEDPECQIEWWMLAGIGKIESFHGHFGSSTLDVNGFTTDKITGPALDGRILEGAEFLADDAAAPDATDRTEVIEIEVAVPTVDTGAELPEPPEPGPVAPAASAPNPAAAAPAPVAVVKRLALIADSDNGLLDGDTVYDRAVGPMQFIPQTWNQYDADGNLDDESDPNNIYDASLASARYLCTAAGSMASEAGQRRAYFAYNHDTEYTENVSAAAERYRRAIEFAQEPEGSAHLLGLANPEFADLGGRTAGASDTVDDDAGLPDW